MFSGKRVTGWRRARLVELLDVGSYLLLVAALTPVVLVRVEFGDGTGILLAVLFLAATSGAVAVPGRRRGGREREH